MISKPEINKLRQKRPTVAFAENSLELLIAHVNVFRSNTGIYALKIDETAGVTLASASTLEIKKFQKELKLNTVAVGKLVAERVQTLNISEKVFDRGGYLYHGRVKALAHAARENGD